MKSTPPSPDPVFLDRDHSILAFNQRVMDWARRDDVHLDAQRLGHQKWYAAFKVRIAKVERDYAL